MSKKRRHQTFKPPTLDEIRARSEKAAREGRYQQALELAKQVYKDQPTPGNKVFLLDTYLGRARQLRGQNYQRDAITVLNVALPLAEGDAARLAQLAEELSLSGAVEQATSLLRRIADPQVAVRVLAHAADAALRKGPTGRQDLPLELHADFDRVLQAWTLSETGQDDPAREALQAIGLRSPFVEWKLLLRGLLAYYQQDDARALENWQRLSPERLPARLAAPLRFSIDPTYRTAQQPAAQTVLQRQADRVQGEGLVNPLRALQKILATEEPLARAFRQVDPLLPALRQQAPHLVPRLAACFFWAIADHGDPEDVLRYLRCFGASPDDPSGQRLHALATEHQGQLQESHDAWQRFDKAIESNPGPWPGEQAARARALIWFHMGEAAEKIPDEEDVKRLPAFLRDHPDRPRPIKPAAADCFERAIALAPSLLDAHVGLVEFYQRKKQTAQAAQAAARLLNQFPDHEPTLVVLGDLRLDQGSPGEALELYQRAMRVNPLDRNLRGRVSRARLFNARAYAEAGQFAEARTEYQAALALYERLEQYTVYCKWAACEFKAGDTDRAEELLRQAQTEFSSRPAVAYSMLIEVIRLKLPKPLKTRFDAEFKDSLTEAPTAAAAVAIADTAATHRVAKIAYPGQKTHEKKVLTYLERAKKLEYTEVQLEELCHDLNALEATKLLIALAKQGQKRFPSNPVFWMQEAEAILHKKTRRPRLWEVQALIRKARPLVEQLPPGERKEELEALLVRLELETVQLNPFAAAMEGAGPLGGLFGQMFGAAGWEEGEDDDDIEDSFF